MWTTKGLGRGILTTSYPRSAQTDPGVTPGRPVPTRLPTAAAAASLARVCPTGALGSHDDVVSVDLSLCVNCLRCRRATPHAMRWTDDFAWAAWRTAPERPAGIFRHSLHVRVLDAGDGGETLRELKQLTGPYYAVHRLGIFVTPSPRDADVLLVVGPVTQGSRRALLDTFEAMPTPKWVMAVGTAAVRGIPFGPSFATASGLADLLPVDLVVPGNPPPPLAILDGLLQLMGRKGAAPVPTADRV